MRKSDLLTPYAGLVAGELHPNRGGVFELLEGGVAQ